MLLLRSCTLSDMRIENMMLRKLSWMSIWMLLTKRSYDTFDILKWWKRHNDTYKVLAQMARDILAVPVSTMSSESAFSISGWMLDQFHSSLVPKQWRP